MTPRWYEIEEDRLVKDLNDGLISQAEFNAEMRELNAELRDAADEYGEQARDDYLGGW